MLQREEYTTKEIWRSLHYRLCVVLVQIFSRFGNTGKRILHKIGIESWVGKTFFHEHGPLCKGAKLTYEPHEWGSIDRCKSCKYPINIKLGFWTERGGMIPPELVSILAAEIKNMHVDPNTGWYEEK